MRVFPHSVFLKTSAAPTILRPARYRKRGERANRRRCARRRRFNKRCRIKTHSNVGTVALCLNVSKRDLSLALKRHLESCPDRHDGEAERTTSTRAGIRLRRGCRLDTQDLVVSNHGRTGRYHVLRTQRGIETHFDFQHFDFQRCRFRSVGHQASRV